jgi:hypothetical protein
MLNDDVISLIMKWRRKILAAIVIQKTWKAYRLQVLTGRYRMLQYLQIFRDLNPTFEEFLKRSRL